MSDVEWDAEEYEPAVSKVLTVSDKWQGEDEEEEVKDKWDDDDDEEEETEEKEKRENEEVKVTKKKKKKTLEEIIKEKEEKKRKELEERRRQEEEAKKKLTPEEMLAEKLRQQKLQEEADLEIAKEAFGVNNEAAGEIDSFEPLTKEDFEKFSGLLRDKIVQFQRSTHFVGFLEILYRDLAVGLDPEDIKRLSSCLNALYNEKNKAQKSSKGKKKGKGGKITLNVGKNDDLEDYTTGVYDDYDDFI